ncbi:hypothetical protein CBI38_27250 [Rhodococcus oxybenzonivorans]|uniref:Uncharacterized protein n=1 Tax=Rhodococcus oxybenzonivorans TaxID=1990687 RepID=A0A2S2C1K6_9NOCA|nr:hypothetical protein [Rhodococcus oxybenzonivorans]AWK74703.1 hypothetical protein CBI38_27250 [Rhodococcus oxybenzonivorans]
MSQVTVTSSSLIFAQSGGEGGGAAFDQIIGITVATAVITIGLLWIAYLHRARKITWLQSIADAAGRKLDRPAWVALPLFTFVGTILTAFFGFIWDVSLHIGRGRDDGPLANPAHYFILVGLFLLFITGMLAMILPRDEKPGPAALKITRTWYVPVGGVLVAGAGLYALIGFPLDDVWHRIFGQDVTLWGPTHLMLIGGAGLSLIGVLLLDFEGRAAKTGETAADSRLIWFLRCGTFGGLIIGLSVFQIEYDFGVEQFRLVLQPMMIAGAAAFALVAARIVLGPFAALVAVAVAGVVRAVTALMVGPVLGAPTNVFELCLGAAVVIELLALTPLIKNRVAFGAVGGFLVATVGLWLESLWIDAMYLYPWPTSMWPEALAMAVPVGIAAGACGALLGRVLRSEGLPRPALSRTIVVATVLVIGGATANGLIATVPENATATVVLTDAAPDGGRMVNAEVTIDPPDLASDDPAWVSILSWQGGPDLDNGFTVDNLERTGPGTYRTNEPVPVHGTWKTLLRVQDGRTMTAVPIFLPSDPGIGAEELPAESSFTREFVPEITILQRERNFDHPSWLFAAASLVVLACTLALVTALAWGAGRIGKYTRGQATADTREDVNVT